MIAASAACASPSGDSQKPAAPAMTAEVRAARYALIRDTAAQMGLYNAALIAGIALSETNLAHCQAEATYACSGTSLVVVRRWADHRGRRRRTVRRHASAGSGCSSSTRGPTPIP